MFEADTITASRRTRRSLNFWRVVAIIAILASFIAIFFAGTRTEHGLGKYSNHIAAIRVDGLIVGNRKLISLIETIAETDRVKALIVRINTPGGTTSGSEAIYNALRKVAAKKPVVASMESMATSGGYITAIAADHIVASGNSITGSIGVIFQWAEVHEMLGRLGIKMQTVKSGKLKAEPNMFAPLKDDVLKVTQNLIDDSFKWFVELVAKRRKMDVATVYKLADGRVYTGRQALANKLVDSIDGEDAALKWLHDEKEIDSKLKVLEWSPAVSLTKASLPFSAIDYLLEAAGLKKSAAKVEKIIDSQALHLDGLLSVWQPAR